MDKKDQILETALRLFNEKGLDNTPTSLIAKESGVSVGTLFNTFRSKEELIKELYISIKKRSREYFAECLNLSLRDTELLRDIWKSIVKWNLDHPQEFLFIGQFTHSPYIAKIKKDVDAYKNMRDLLIGLIGKKDIAKEHPEFVFQYLQTYINATTEYIKDKNVEDIDTFIDNSFDLFWNGIN